MNFTKRRVFLVDDHPIVRSGLTQLINCESDLAVCGTAEEMHSALESISELKPDILIIDISLNGPDGLDLLKAIRSKDPSLPVLVLSMHDELTYAERALRAGANGYIMKQEATDRVLVAIRRILNREIYVSDRMANKMLRRFVASGSAVPRSLLDELSDRELEVLRLIGTGHGRGQEDRVRNAAALHMREAGVRIAPQMQMGIEDRSAPIWHGLGLNVRCYNACAQHRFQKSSSLHVVTPLQNTAILASIPLFKHYREKSGALVLSRDREGVGFRRCLTRAYLLAEHSSLPFRVPCLSPA